MLLPEISELSEIIDQYNSHTIFNLKSKTNTDIKIDNHKNKYEIKIFKTTDSLDIQFDSRYYTYSVNVFEGQDKSYTYYMNYTDKSSGFHKFGSFVFVNAIEIPRVVVGQTSMGAAFPSYTNDLSAEEFLFTASLSLDIQLIYKTIPKEIAIGLYDHYLYLKSNITRETIE